MTNKAQSSQAPRDRRHGLGFFRKALLGGLACAALGALTTSAAMAQATPTSTPAPAATPAAPAVPDVKKKETTETPPAQTCDLSSANISKCFGLGIAVGGFFFTEPDITSTTIDPGNIVRVTEEHQREASLWFEIHATVIPIGKVLPGSGLEDVTFGPFAALQLGGTSSTLSSFAVGGMIFFPMRTPDPTDKSLGAHFAGLGLGLGYGWTQIHKLGDGITEDQPLPAGLTTVRTKQTDIGGLVVMLSTTVAF